MPASLEPDKARATSRTDGAVLEVSLGGPWRLGGETPRWRSMVAKEKPAGVRLRADGVSVWDTSLVVFLGEAQHWCADSGIACDTEALPEKMRILAGQFEASLRTQVHVEHSQSLLVEVGLSTREAMDQLKAFLSFVGECCLGAARLVMGSAGFRWKDCMSEIQKCGAMALPIVSLISFLVGVTLAYSGAIVLRRFGGDILGGRPDRRRDDAREMGAMMAGIVLAGRTGAAYAAEIGKT